MTSQPFPFLSWIGLAKNTRGVLFFSPDRWPSPDKIARLARRHRYRSLGLPPGIALRIEQQAEAQPDVAARLRRRPFAPLPHPFPAGAEAVRNIASHSRHHDAVDALLCSMEYAAPLIFCRQDDADAFAPFCIWERRAAAPLDDSQFIRHLRIAAYAVVDFYPLAAPAFALFRECLASRTDEAVRPASLREAIQRLSRKRREQAAADGRKRYWRIEEDRRGPRVLAYFDLFPAVADGVLKTSAPLPDALARETAGLGFGIAAGVWME